MEFFFYRAYGKRLKAYARSWRRRIHCQAFLEALINSTALSHRAQPQGLGLGLLAGSAADGCCPAPVLWSYPLKEDDVKMEI